MRPADISALIDDPAGRRDVSALELTQALLERIEQLNPRLNAFITVLADRATADARKADRTRRSRVLEGMVIGVKDNIAVAGAPMTAGSRLYLQHVPAEDAEAVQRLTRAGAIVIGKTHLHELAMGSTSDNPFFGPCRNPWDQGLSPGGSSGGSAVAVAADLCLAALGTDTGGSIRNPAAICGVTGLRPTFGRVSNLGVIPVAPSFDTVGPIARSAADVAALFRVLTGVEHLDQKSTLVGALTVGVLHCEHFDDGMSDESRKALEATVMRFEDLGIDVVDLDPGNVRQAEMDFFQLLKSESAASHAEELDSRPQDFSKPLRTMLMATRSSPCTDSRAALRGATRWRKHVLETLFKRCDVLLTALQLDRPVAFGDPLLNPGVGRSMRFTFPWSLAKLPAVAVPCGAFSDGLPIGCQLVGRPNADAVLLDLAIRYQESTDWHRRRPPLNVPE